MSRDEPVGGLAAELWHACKQEVALSLAHPFITALSKGTLDRPTFRAYIAQDACYLKSFAQAYALAAEKAQHKNPHARQLLLELRQGVLEEAKLHAQYAVELGISELELQQPHAATQKYTAFLLKVAQHEEIDCILAALTPCNRLYAFLGCRLAAKSLAVDHPYLKWIKTYSAPEYLELPAKLEGLLNAFGSEAPKSRLLDLYREAMQLEIAFFDAHMPQRSAES